MSRYIFFTNSCISLRAPISPLDTHKTSYGTELLLVLSLLILFSKSLIIKIIIALPNYNFILLFYERFIVQNQANIALSTAYHCYKHMLLKKNNQMLFIRRYCFLKLQQFICTNIFQLKFQGYPTCIAIRVLRSQ